VLQLDDTVGSLATHVMDSILISEPVGSLDGIVHVPSPVILSHVAQSSVDTSLDKSQAKRERVMLDLGNLDVASFFFIKR